MSHYTYPGGYLEAQRSRDNEIDALEQKLARADARIAELEQAVVIRDTEIARLETDLELARMDAERWRYCNANAEWFRNEWRTHFAVEVSKDADLSCKAFRAMAIDAARAGNGGGV